MIYPILYLLYSVVTVLLLMCSVPLAELNALGWLLISVILAIYFIRDIDNSNIS